MKKFIFLALGIVLGASCSGTGTIRISFEVTDPVSGTVHVVCHNKVDEISLYGNGRAE